MNKLRVFKRSLMVRELEFKLVRKVGIRFHIQNIAKISQELGFEEILVNVTAPDKLLMSEDQIVHYKVIAPSDSRPPGLP